MTLVRFNSLALSISASMYAKATAIPIPRFDTVIPFSKQFEPIVLFQAQEILVKKTIPFISQIDPL
jgi:hypothetical protein